ncbi:MAG: di-heme oxidoredictase family protein [Sandaracinaceae bacterium]
MRAVVALIALFALGCDPLDGITVVGEDPSDAPIAGLEAPWDARFLEGDPIFDASFRESQGLGPLYIRFAQLPVTPTTRGPGVVRRMALVDEDGVPLTDQSALAYGPVIRPQLAAGATTAIVPPEDRPVWVASRLPPAVFGRGYLEAIEDAEIERVAAEQAATDDGVHGRIHRVSWQSEATPDRGGFHDYGPGREGLIGRFGLKARIATIDEFTADAYQGDMGITSPLRPTELPNPDGVSDDARVGVDIDVATVRAAADYVRLLAIPRREPPPDGGPELFASIGCATCHVPTLRTRADYPIPPLAGIDAPVYTDLLLHDMGPDLADAAGDLDAGPRDWRTAPLMGLRHQSAYLHDGRALTVEDAIVMHGGEASEARGSVEAFEALSGAERRLLLDFVNGL